MTAVDGWEAWIMVRLIIFQGRINCGCSCREPRCEQEPSCCVPEGASLRRRARLVSTHPSADRAAPGEKDFYRLSAIFSSLTRKLVCKGDLSG